MESKAETYATTLDCEHLAHEIGQTIRLQTHSGKVLVGKLQLVSCEEPPQLMMDVYTNARFDSTAFVRMHAVSDIIVLRKPKPAGGAFVVGTIFGLALGVALLVAAFAAG